MRSAARDELIVGLKRAREQTLKLVSHLAPAQWQVPYLDTVNPPLWEIAHVAWVQEFWCLRWQNGAVVKPCLLPDGDAWFDSRSIAHRPRWSLPMPAHAEIFEYMAEVLDRTIDGLRRAPDTAEKLYFYRLVLFHEQMHIEALAYTWQTLDVSLGLPEKMPSSIKHQAGGAVADRIDACTWALGAARASAAATEPWRSSGEDFIFDNEKWSNPIEIASFEIASEPVSNAEYLQFIRDQGYSNPSFWDPDFFAQLNREGRQLPCYWREHNGQIQRRRFDIWETLPLDETLVHVSAFEAQAFCSWAGKRLPTEAEWEVAAHKAANFCWGDRVWEWTASTFEPFEGFTADPYTEYSIPSFGNTRVVRGGSYLTPRPLVHPKFRNFFAPQRHDMFVGFRTCRSL